MDFIKKYYHKLQEELKKGTKGNLVTIDNKELNDENLLFLSIYSKNRNLPDEFFTVENIKKTNKKLKPESKSLEIPVNLVVNNKLVIFAEDILDIYPDFDFKKPKKEQLEQVKLFILKNKITCFSPNSFDPGSAFNKIEFLPIKNVSYTTEEIISAKYIQNQSIENKAEMQWDINIKDLERILKTEFNIEDYLYLNRIAKDKNYQILSEEKFEKKINI